MLILHPTDTSQWHALLNEAQAMRQCQLNEDVESYLVFLLMRFTEQPEVSSSILALDFLETQHEVGQQRFERLKEVGDKSLLFSGLFPGLAEKRRVQVDYFINLGQSAYGSISVMEDAHTNNLYACLCQEFVLLKELLNSMRSLTPPLTN